MGENAIHGEIGMDKLRHIGLSDVPLLTKNAIFYYRVNNFM
jgi:hypothetical protein